MILDNGHNCDMPMMFLPVELCQSYVIGSISFVHMVLVLATILKSTKSFVVVNERWKSDAAAVFGDLGVQVVTGHRFLGGFIGSPMERDEYVMSKVDRWVRHIDVLSEAASSQPQLAYTVLSRSLQHEWTFLLRVVPQCGQLFQKLDLSLFLVSYQPCLVLKSLQLNYVCLRFL